MPSIYKDSTSTATVTASTSSWRRVTRVNSITRRSSTALTASSCQSRSKRVATPSISCSSRFQPRHSSRTCFAALYRVSRSRTSFCQKSRRSSYKSTSLHTTTSCIPVLSSTDSSSASITSRSTSCSSSCRRPIKSAGQKSKPSWLNSNKARSVTRSCTRLCAART